MNTRPLALTLLLVLAPVFAMAAEPTIIVNPANDVSEISAQDLAQIFLGKKTLWPSGKRIVPVLLDTETEAGRHFLMGYVKKTESQYRSYWKRRLYSGGGAVPKTLASSAAVSAYVATTPGAIGVIEAEAATGTVKAVVVTSED